MRGSMLVGIRTSCMFGVRMKFLGDCLLGADAQLDGQDLAVLQPEDFADMGLVSAVR